VILDVGKEFKQDLSAEEAKEKDIKNLDLESLRKWIKEVLGNKITRVEASTRLIDSPAMIVQSEFGVSPNMQKYLKAQSVVEKEQSGQFSDVFNQAVLELNPKHPIIIDLKRMYDIDPNSPEANERVHVLFNTAALAAGYTLDNAADYSKMITKLMTQLAL
jgi:heat shock protein beta